MEEIKVGEYVRTKDGIIGIFEHIDEHCRHYGESLEDTIYIIHTEKNEYLRLTDTDIAKHCPNIIDLIEEGDYVNGQKVISVLDGFVEGTMEIELLNHKIIYRRTSEEIKSIVTKEQFQSVEYTIREDK